MTLKLTPISDESAWLDLKKKYITSTETPSLFGLQMPSLPTAFELFHIKRGEISGEVEANNYMIWGRIFEVAITEVIKADNPEWRISPLRVFAHDDDDRMGSSFDNFLIHPEKGNCLLEIKMTSYREYKEKYIEDDDGEFIEAPAYYEVQCQHQLELMGQYEWICLAVAIVDTRDIKYIWRQRDRDFGASIRKKIKWFWDLDISPPPDLVKDSDLLARLHRANSNDSVYDGTEDGEFQIAAMSYKQEGDKETAAKEAKKKARSEMILRMGANNQAWCNGYKVTNKVQFRVTEVKGK